MKRCGSTGANEPASRSEVVDLQPAVHLFPLRLTGAVTLREARVPVRVEAHRDRLPVVKRGDMPWTEVDAWRKELHRDLERVLAEARLAERLDQAAANRFLIKARREMANRP
ncbi:MAG: nucleotidyltransferase domain-containing protein [Verrucomicrobia bacterium]|nr:nucleotidyltransferase domain-containing protein [Verrucomicrobiota bacterium]